MAKIRPVPQPTDQQAREAREGQAGPEAVARQIEIRAQLDYRPIHEAMWRLYSGASASDHASWGDKGH